jgi:hypothetical protein
VIVLALLTDDLGGALRLLQLLEAKRLLSERLDGPADGGEAELSTFCGRVAIGGAPSAGRWRRLPGGGGGLV